MGLIGAHSGIEYKNKKLNKTNGKCLACNEYSECQIIERKKVLHIAYMPIWQLEVTYLFDWKKCNHCVELVQKEDIKRYKEEQVETKNYQIPHYSGMAFKIFESPKEFSTITLILITGTISLIALILGVLLYIAGVRLPFWLF